MTEENSDTNVQPVRVLIVDDEPNIVISLAFLMRTEGFEVQEAGDGEDALVEIEDWQPDVVLLDIMMPKLDGYEVLQRLRDHERYGTPVVIVLTARGQEAEAAKGLALGASRYVTKPFSTRELVATVREALDLP